MYEFEQDEHAMWLQAAKRKGGAELAPISSASPPPIRSGKGGGGVMRKIASAGRVNVWTWRLFFVCSNQCDNAG